MGLTDQDLIKRTIEQETIRFGALHQNLRAAQGMYYGDFKIPVTATLMEPPKLHTAARVVDEIVDHILLRYIKVTARPQDSGDKDAAEKRSKFLSGFWHTVFQQTQVNPLRQAGKYLAIGDVGALKTAPDVDAYPDPDLEVPQEEDESGEDYKARLRRLKRRDEYVFPFTVRAPNPIWLLWQMGTNQPKWVAERRTRYGRDLKDEFPEDEIVGRLTPDGPYSVTEWWDNDGTFAFLLDAHHFLMHERKDIGIPYAIKFGGAGLTDEQERPEFMADGMLHRHRQAFIEESATYNAFRAVTRRLVFPDWRTNTDEGYQVLPGEGRVWLLQPETDIGRIDWGTLDPVIERLLTAQGKYIEMDTAPSIIRGVRQPGTSSAAEMAMQLQEVRLLFESLLMTIQGLVELANITVLRTIDEVFRKGIRVYGETPYGDDLDQMLDASDINGAYANKVLLMAGPAEDLERQADASLRQLEAGARSLETHIREGQKRQDPRTEMAAIRADIAVRSPRVQDMISNAIAILAQQYLAARGLVTAQRSLSQSNGQAAGTEMTEAELAGNPTLAPPGSEQERVTTENELRNAQEGTTERQRALVP